MKVQTSLQIFSKALINKLPIFWVFTVFCTTIGRTVSKLAIIYCTVSYLHVYILINEGTEKQTVLCCHDIILALQRPVLPIDVSYCRKASSAVSWSAPPQRRWRPSCIRAAENSSGCPTRTARRNETSRFKSLIMDWCSVGNRCGTAMSSRFASTRR